LRLALLLCYNILHSYAVQLLIYSIMPLGEFQRLAITFVIIIIPLNVSTSSQDVVDELREILQRCYRKSYSKEFQSCPSR
jgi:hypothetical protein